MDNNNKWDELSLTEKSEIMKQAVANGITNLNEIRQTYNEYADGGSMDNPPNQLPEVEVTAQYPYEQRVIDTMNNSNPEFLERLRNNDRRSIHNSDGTSSTHVLGSADNIVFPEIMDVNGKLVDNRRMPWQSAMRYAIKNNDYIEFPTEGDARYFGEHYKKYFPEFFSNTFKGGGYIPSASIKKDIIDFEGSSMKTNRSFEAEAKDFNRVIPQAIRNKLSQRQLDALYSYGYNVGMGNLRDRVLPTLTAYTQGRAGADDVAASMWASKDPYMKGLQRRRAYERNMFTGNSPVGTQGSIVDRAINMDLSNLPTVAQFTGETPKFQYDLFPPNPTDYGTPIDWSTPEKKVEAPVAAPKEDNGLGLLALINQIYDNPKQEPLATYTPQRNNSMFVVSAPTGNDTFLDSSWFKKGGYLYEDGGKAPTIFKTSDGYTTASGHPVEQIGWDDNGYARYRDTVTGDLGHSFEPSDAYTKTLVDVTNLPKKEKELEIVSPEFDFMDIGGFAKNLGEWALKKASNKITQKAATKMPLESELDWSPESWFGTRVKGVYDADDVAALKSHVPEYLTIERNAKANGTWLKMPDGSTWEGDPRSWVQLQSKEGQKLMQKPFYHGEDGTYLNGGPDGIDVTPEVLGEKVIWASSNKHLPQTYGSHHYVFSVPKDTEIVGIDAQGKNWNDLKGLGLGYEKTDDVSYDLLKDNNVVEIKNVTDFGDDPRWKPGTNGVPEKLPNEEDYQYYDRVFNGDDYIIGEDTPRKSLLGNNGNFDLTNPNIYKAALPWAIPATLWQYYDGNSEIK